MGDKIEGHRETLQHHLAVSLRIFKGPFIDPLWCQKAWAARAVVYAADIVENPLHWENYTSISFHIEWDMIVVTVFLWMLNQMEFHLVQNRKENCDNDHIPFNLKGIGNIVFSVWYHFVPVRAWMGIGVGTGVGRVLITGFGDRAIYRADCNFVLGGFFFLWNFVQQFFFSKFCSAFYFFFAISFNVFFFAILLSVFFVVSFVHV